MLYLQSIFLGFALAMDASCVMISNSLNEKEMKKNKTIFISFIFAFFQALMPLLGYFLGFLVLSFIDRFIPYIALVLLSFLGLKMIFTRNKEVEVSLTYKTLFVQAIATSIDAFSVGFTIANYKIMDAIITCLIIALTTFILCLIASFVGKSFKNKLGTSANLVGGIILILIGIRIFISGIK